MSQYLEQLREDSRVESDNGFNEYKRLLLAELERLDNSVKVLGEKLDKVQIEIATLKVKSGAWGALGAMIPIGLAMLVYFLQK